MTDFALLLAPDRGQKARPIHLVDKDSFEAWVKGRPAEDRALLEAHHFDGKKAFAFILLPRGGDFEVVSAVANAGSLSPWCLATLGERLPEGTYKLASGEPAKAALGWLLGQHRFDTYRSKPDPDRGPRVLVTGEAASIEQTVRLAEATALVRDLVDTPAADLGPAELEQAVREEAGRSGAHVRVTTGDKLAKEYPLIAAVGAAATPERAPRPIDFDGGKPGDPRIATAAKGACLDRAGAAHKPPPASRILKKKKGGGGR